MCLGPFAGLRSLRRTGKELIDHAPPKGAWPSDPGSLFFPGGGVLFPWASKVDRHAVTTCGSAETRKNKRKMPRQAFNCDFVPGRELAPGQALSERKASPHPTHHQSTLCPSGVTETFRPASR